MTVSYESGDVQLLNNHACAARPRCPLKDRCSPHNLSASMQLGQVNLQRAQAPCGTRSRLMIVGMQRDAWRGCNHTAASADELGLRVDEAA